MTLSWGGGSGLVHADDAHAIREADIDVLSLALIDARNLTLRWLAAFEQRQAAGDEVLRTAARAAAWQDRWIARNLQRQRGEEAQPDAAALAPARAEIDDWLAHEGPPPQPDELRGWMEQTLETTCDLLAMADPVDRGLHFFRVALRHEDRLGERLAEIAAEVQLHDDGEAAPPWRTLAARPARPPLWFPAQAMQLGSAARGTVPEFERWAHEVAVPDFEIDAQPVNWERFVEFAEDGGYDRRELWSDAGWAWVQAEGRRAPRHVEQLRGAVLVQRRGRLQRVALGQPVLHASRHEAEAWCRWAGRRLPTEPEWELAAVAGTSRGFVWGDVFEWVAGSARPWPGYSAGAGALDRLPEPGALAVLRGASWMTRSRERHPRARRFLAPQADQTFAGFRSCAL